MLFAEIDFTFVIPLVVFVGFVGAVWAVLSTISNRNSRTQERLTRMSRPQSLADIDDKAPRKERFQGVMDTAKALSGPLMPGTELEQSALKTRLANAGFRSDSAVAVYLGLRFGSLLVFFVLSLAYALPRYGLTIGGLKWVVILSGLGFYLPTIILWFIRRKRQQEIFLTLPDALDLLVVCVESGLGLDAAMRKVCEEMKHHAKVICEEFNLANFQLQMGARGARCSTTSACGPASTMCAAWRPSSSRRTASAPASPRRCASSPTRCGRGASRSPRKRRRRRPCS